MWLKIILGLMVAITALAVYSYFRQKYIQSKQTADFKRIFGDWESSMPALDFGSSYGLTTFTVTFQKKDDLKIATKNKLTDDFKNCIKSYYSSKFDADLAVYFAHLETDKLQERCC